jgi:hypothetical protein
LWKKGLYVGPVLAMDSNAPVGVVIATNGQTRTVGTLIFDNGTNEGEIKDGMANGHGTWMNTNGFKYVGEFEDDEWYGRGMVTTSKPMDEWADCKPHGQGRLTAPDGTKQSGLWKDDRDLGPAPAQTNTPPASGTDKKP